ncbi:hypothetical protein L2K20_08100 [Mycobacterium sp. MBM]|nr:hypothetical protein [Mycobacterium sp. MBM]
MSENWISRLARMYRRAGIDNRWDTRDAEGPDARRVRSELDAIRARFPDHA